VSRHKPMSTANHHGVAAQVKTRRSPAPIDRLVCDGTHKGHGGSRTREIAALILEVDLASRGVRNDGGLR
jgi:hypothetical protein